MPLVEVTLIQGRSAAKLRSIVREVHEAVVRTAEVPADEVHVILREVPAANWATGDVTIEERRASQEPR